MNNRNRFIFFLIALLMPLAMVAQTNHWTPVSAPYEDNMTLTGIIQINGAEQQSTALEVGAFCGTECRGSARPVLFSVTGRYVFSLTIFGDNGDQITFKLYDHNQGMELNLQSPAAITFGANGLGSPIDPYVLNFTAENYTISVLSNPAAGGMVSGAGTYSYGSTCTLTASANRGYTFTNWTKNGAVVSTSTSYSFTVTENASYVANFSQNSYTISASANPSAGGSVTGAGNYNYGATCNLTATANTGYTFTNWTKNGTVVSTSASYSFTVTSSGTYVANFSQNTCTISASANPSAGGSVTGAGNYNYGATCTLTATANTGYTFTNWTKNGTVVSTSANYSFTVTGSGTYVANFSQNTYTISASVTPSAGGSVSGAGNYNYGATCNLTATANTGYTFTNWTENGEVVSTEATYCFTVTGDRELVANYFSVHVNGQLNGVFSVGENTVVNFSQGNLQYQASTNTWRFATNQWDRVGNDNANISESYDGWIDLFGWGTSGYNHGAICYQPWSTSQNYSDYYAYGQPTYNLYDQNRQADWGYNAITNGGNQTNQWRTLTIEEWDYVFFTRQASTVNGVDNARYAKGVVNGRNGVILFPDVYTHPSGVDQPNNINTADAYFSNYSNNYQGVDWELMENAGCVFLPVTGRRDGTSVINAGGFGGYWSASSINSEAWYIGIWLIRINTEYECYRSNGFSVRLARVAENYSYDINAMPNPAEGGTVSGGGTYEEGATCTLTATPAIGYAFTSWTENGEVVSTEATYSFTVTGDRTLVANFTQQSPFIPTEDLVAYYPFDGDANDYSGNGYHATPCNNYQYEEGVAGECIAVEGQGYMTSSGGHVLLPQYDFSGASGVTLSLWVKALGLTSDDETYINFGFDTDADRLYIKQSSNEIRFAYHDSQISIPYESSYTGDWVMYTLTCGSDGKLRAYVDGVLLGEQDVNYDGNINTSWAALGRHWWYSGSATSTRFIGSFDEVRIYNYALSPQEVNSLYNQSGGGFIDGVLPGVFSVGEGSSVNFSQGNLQWSATGGGTDATSHAVADGGTAAGIWRFAEHQYDYIGSDNNNVSSTYNGWIDIFGYGTSGWNSGATYYQPYDTEWSANGYASGNLNGDMAYADWGIYNAISNGGNNPSQWRTLSQAEFRYMLNTRQASTVNGTENARYAKASINGTNGLILLPDNYTHPSGSPALNNINVSTAVFEDNPYTIEQWNLMETVGAVFLPAAGWRANEGFREDNAVGRYRTTTEYDFMRSYTMQFHNDYVSAEEGWSNNAWGDKRDGHSVRLVKDVHLTSYTIDATTDPAEGGTVTGAGIYNAGETCALTATANNGYTFLNWTKDGNQVSTEATYSFTVTESATYVANFSLDAFHFTFAGTWSTASNWQGGALPGADDEVFIDAPCQLDQDATVATLTVTEGQSLTLQSGKMLIVTNTLTNTSTSGLVIEDGAQLMHDSNNVSATVKKNIAGHGTNTGKYRLISNPLASAINPELEGIYHITQGNYDLYNWLATASDHLEWRNFKDNTFMMSPEGYGYLYANQNGIELNFPGALRPSHNRFAKSVSCDSDNTEHSGWNLIGNPFVCNAKLVDANNEPLPYYRMNAAGNGFEAVAPGTPIAPLEGVFYKASVNGTVYFIRADYSDSHAYVDLGLPSGLLWATCNVGANSPEDYGDYFAWGETQTKDVYNWNTYQYCNGSSSTLTKYCNNSSYGYNGFTDNLATLLPEDDAATANWGSNWRMPTKEEWQELYQNTTHTWTTQNGVNGRLFTAANGNSLFLPAAGCRWGSELNYAGSYGYYGSRSLYTDYPYGAWYLSFGSDYCGMSSGYRYYGLSVRPVRSARQN